LIKKNLYIKNEPLYNKNFLAQQKKNLRCVS